jgi:hypothetical protein
MFHELRENCLANIHPSLSAMDAEVLRQMSGAVFGQKKFKWKNLENQANLPHFKPLAEIHNSSPGQQW